MRSRKKTAAVALTGGDSSSSSSSLGQRQQQYCYEGERLTSLLESLEREIGSTRLLDGGGVLPEKFWIKQQFAVGVNEVTRVLERMPPISEADDISHTSSQGGGPPPSVKLQAIVLAADSNPRWLTKHLLQGLASSRGVPLLLVKDNNRAASLKLGQLLKLKTAIAIGIKARGNTINQLIDKIVTSNDIQFGSEA